MLRQSCAGRVPIPRIPLSWLGTESCRTSRCDGRVPRIPVIDMQLPLNTEAERLTGAISQYLSSCSDDEAFNFGAYNTIPRSHGIRPQELVKHCATLIDALITATQGTGKV